MEVTEKRAKRGLANVQDYKKVFSSAEGKRVLWDLMKHSGLMSTSFVPNDPHATSYNEGTRQTVLHIIQKLNTDIKTLEKMIKEGAEYDRSIFDE